MKAALCLVFLHCAGALASTTAPIPRVNAEASGQGSVGVVDGNVDIHVGVTFADIDRVLKARDREYEQRLQELTAKVNALADQDRSRKADAISEEVVRHVLSVLQAQKVPQTQWPRKLTDLTHGYAISRSRLRALRARDHGTQRLLAEALESKDPRLADKLLEEAAGSALEQANRAKHAAAQFSRDAAEMDVCRASLAMLNLDPKGAATQLETAFNLRADDADIAAVSWLLQAGDLLLHAGDSGNAIRLYRRALTASSDSVTRGPTNTEWRRISAAAGESLGMALVEGRYLDEAIAHLEESLRIRSALVVGNPSDSVSRRELLRSHRSLADALLVAHKVPEAARHLDAAMEIAVALVAVEPTKPLWQRDLLIVSEDMEETRQKLGLDADRALRVATGAIGFANQILASDPSNTQWRVNAALAQEMIAFIGTDRGNLDDAAKAQQEALRVYEALDSEDPDKSNWRPDLLRVHTNSGLVLMKQGRTSEAVTQWTLGLRLAQDLLARDPAAARWKFELSRLHQKVGDALWKLGTINEALDEYRTAEALLNQLVAMDPAMAKWQEALWQNDVNVGERYAVQNSNAEALERFQKALSRVRNLADRAPADVDWQLDLLESLERMGDIYRQVGKRAEALTSFNEAAQIAHRFTLVKDSGNYWRCHLEYISSAIGKIQAEQGHYDLAARQYNRAIRVATELVADEPADDRWQQKLSRAWRQMGNLNMRRGNRKQALEDYQNSSLVAKRLLDSHPDDILTLNTALLGVWLIRHTHTGNEDDRNLLRRGIDASDRLRAIGTLTDKERSEYVRRIDSVLADWPNPESRRTSAGNWAEHAVNAIWTQLTSGIASLRNPARTTRVLETRSLKGRLYAKIGEGGRAGLCAEQAAHR